MFLKQIALTNFRNYEAIDLAFEPRGSLIVGPNGSGKTNLLEAIAYCGIGKSVRFHRDEDLLRYDSPFFAVSALFSPDKGYDLKLQLSYAERIKLLKLDDSPLRQLSSLFDMVKVIYSAPEDLMLVGGSPRFRRQYFDLAVAQLQPDYIPVLRGYLHIVHQRNALLKGDFETPEKAVWDERFIQSLQAVLGYRRRYLAMLNAAFKDQYCNISEKTKNISVNYLPALREDYPSTEEPLRNILAQIEPRERKFQRSLIGAHLDDYEFKLCARSLKVYGSQGQKRIAVIVLKLIQASLIEKHTHIKPIMLFDDIFAELDLPHTKRIRELVDQRFQIFIASPKPDIANIWDSLPLMNMESM
ncbi:MAG: DNA replication and repair protein RecF [Candidatus Cloacimonadaceae bacterium]|nr:DNA replication and repair protein RecF [Candidatus Cloacimonadaceae bacterium]MDP3114296.1 DNA replication and repair protein RecF [Candidatus Cloacimonadaceae bacterium]